MGILSRFTDIMSANIDDILSKAENSNSDKLLEKYINDAQENLGKLKAETAAVMADETNAGRKLIENDSLCKKYEGYAQEAVKAGNDDDAKKFLAYVQQLQQKHEDLQRDYDVAKENSEKMKEMTSKLISDINTSQGKLKELKLKLNVAKQQESLNKINERISQDPLGNFGNMMDAVQNRIDKADAANQLNMEASSSPEDEVAELAKKYGAASSDVVIDSVDDQLAKLKAQLQPPQQ